MANQSVYWKLTINLKGSIRLILENGVSIHNTDNNPNLAIPEIPFEEPEIVKKRKLALKAKKTLISDLPMNSEDIEHINELTDLYSTNELTSLIKWTTTQEHFLHSYKQLTFTHPTEAKQLVDIGKRKLVAEADGFFVGNPPQVTPWNYERLLNRLLITDPTGNWFSSPITLNLLPDPMCLKHYIYANSNNLNEKKKGDGDIESIRHSSTYNLSFQSALTLNKFQEGSNKSFQLVIDLVGLQLLNHPLILEEIQLVTQLQHLTKTIQERKRSKIVTYLTSKIETLRLEYLEKLSDLEQLSNESIEQTSENFQSESPLAATKRSQVRLKSLKIKNGQKKLDSEQELIQLLTNLQATRLLRDSESQTDRLLDFQVVKCWEEIKQTRIKQCFTSTGIKLSIKSKKRSERDMIDMEKEMEEEISERLMLNELKYKESLNEYEKNMISWKMKVGAKDTILEEPLNNELSEKDIPNEFSDGDSLIPKTPQSKRHSKALKKRKSKKLSLALNANEGKPIEPELPVLSTKKLKSEIETRLISSHPTKHHPRLQFVIENKAQITNTSDSPKIEQLRRSKLNNTSCFLKISYNGIQVTKTIPKLLDPLSFEIKFNGINDLQDIDKLSRNEIKQETLTAFAITLKELPKSLKVQMYESGIIGDRLLGEVFVPIPSESECNLSLDRQVQHIEFTGPTYLSLEKAEMKYKGLLKMNLSWAATSEGELLSPQGKHLNKPQHFYPLYTLGPVGIVNLPKMLEWVWHHKFDPNDPRNIDLLTIHQLLDRIFEKSDMDMSTSTWNNQLFFRPSLPEWLHRITLGVGPSDWHESQPRFDLLIQRQTKEVVFSEPIPLILENASISTIKAGSSHREKKEAEVMNRWSTRMKFDDLSPSDDGTDLGFLKRIRELQAIRKAALMKPLHVDDFVSELRLEPIPAQESPFAALFRPWRPLNPHRTTRKDHCTSDIEQCQLSIQVVQAFNLPIRRESSNGKSKTATSLRPYVEISFQKKKSKTSTSEGSHPIWNETINLSIEAQNSDFRPESLMETDIATEMVYINIFDELIVDLIEDERQREHSTYIRRDRIWIGSVNISLSTIWERSRLDGRFPISIPMALLGYVSEDAMADVNVSTIQQSQLHIFMTLDPPLAQPPPLVLKFQTDEDSAFFKHVKKWQETGGHLGRPVLALSQTITGKTTFICRFIRPQNPPPNHNLLGQLTRYVSLIPFLPNRSVFAVTCNLWSTSDQILNVGAADCIEHAILLCNYLLFLEHEAYVVLGKSLFEGSTAFVLIKNSETKEIDTNPTPTTNWKSSTPLLGTDDPVNLGPSKKIYQLCNPVTGQMYDTDDINCSLTEVHSVFNHQNIWNNIQNVSTLQKVSFKLEDSNLWKAFHGPHFPAMSHVSIQPPTLTYEEVSPSWLTELELHIERNVIAKFETFRIGNVTKWNRLCSKTLKTILSTLESDLVCGISLTDKLLKSKDMVSISRVYKVNGHPLNMPYTDVAAICKAVHNTEIHSNISNGVEFGLGISCHAYPGKFVSVWIFLVSLIRN
ncbi:hypothetical protein BC833DRAFT_104494 [Globomyces pollinis-pini]|nr:hypothetical protein BC833DRAFT_104494 [Globomyces pollinis-pini]